MEQHYKSFQPSLIRWVFSLLLENSRLDRKNFKMMGELADDDIEEALQALKVSY